MTKASSCITIRAKLMCLALPDKQSRRDIFAFLILQMNKEGKRI